MKKQLLAVAVSTVVFAGVAFATQILETPVTPTTNKTTGVPSVRPSLQKLLDKRPSLPVKRPILPHITTGSVAHPEDSMTGEVETGTVKEVIRTVIQQNAEDVAAYRADYGYITRYLQKPATVDARKATASAVEMAIRTLLDAQKQMRTTYESGAASGNLMTRATWDSLAEAAVDAYRTAVLPYVDTTKMTNFERFILGRTNLMKSLFDKLETIRLVKSQ